MSRSKESTELVLIPIEEAHPHPDNPRVVMREDVVAALVANMNGEYPKKHAIHVRKQKSGYQILSGHTRTEAAKRKGYTHVWAWIEDMDDAAAFMELVTSNNQGELSPLEIGIHALKAVPKAEGGRGKKGGLSAYAERLGKTSQYIGQIRQAAEVFATLKPETQVSGFLDKVKHLCAIHALPEECWQYACEWLAENKDATVKDVSEQVEKANDFAKQFKVPKEWRTYLPLHRCIWAVFAGSDPKRFNSLAALAVKVAEDFAEHDDLVQQWREWLESNVGGESWDMRAVHAKRTELEDIQLERDATGEDGEDDADVKHGDFREVVKQLEDESVDLIFTDPPYDRETMPQRQLYGTTFMLASNGGFLRYNGLSYK